MPVAMAKMFGSKTISSAGKADVLGEQFVGAAADLDLALDRVGLPLFVEGHDDSRPRVAAGQSGVAQETLLTLLE